MPLRSEGRVDEDIVQHFPLRCEEGCKEAGSRVASDVVGYEALKEFGGFGSMEADESAVGELCGA